MIFYFDICPKTKIIERRPYAIREKVAFPGLNAKIMGHEGKEEKGEKNSNKCVFDLAGQRYGFGWLHGTGPITFTGPVACSIAVAGTGSIR